MSRREVSIGELGRIVTGKTPPTGNREFYDGEYPFVTPTDLDWQSYIVRSTHSSVTELARNRNKNQFIPANSTVFTCIGNTIGKCGLSAVDCLTNQQINSVVPDDEHDPKFVYYLLNYHRPKIRSLGLGNGAAQPIINKTTFSGVKVSVPATRDDEQRIAAILSAYDDLIENNRRRIALLEEAARQLYKEWFVRFRFPGHEHVKIIDGVPDGWERKLLGEIARVVMGQSPQSKFYNDAGIGLPFHQGVTNYGFRFVSHQTYSSAVTKLAEANDILVSVRAPVGRINITLDRIVLGRGLSAIRSKSGHQSFLLYALKEHFYAEDIIGTGAIYAATNKKELEAQQMLIPVGPLVTAFEEASLPIDRQITNLTKSVAYLTKARDLLLPKLMSGAIAV